MAIHVIYWGLIALFGTSQVSGYSLSVGPISYALSAVGLEPSTVDEQEGDPPMTDETPFSSYQCPDVIPNLRKIGTCCEIPVPTTLIQESNFKKCDGFGQKDVALPAVEGITGGGTNLQVIDILGGTSVLTCVFKNLDFIKNGAVDFASVTSSFVANVDQIWRPVVQAAVGNCSLNVTNKNCCENFDNLVMCKPTQLLPQRFIFFGGNPIMEPEPRTPDCISPPGFEVGAGTDTLMMLSQTTIIATPVNGMEPSTDINPSNTQLSMMAPCVVTAVMDNAIFMNAMRPMDSEIPQMAIETRIGGVGKNHLGPKKDENVPKTTQIALNQRVDMVKQSDNNNKFEQVKSKTTKKPDLKKNIKKKTETQPSILSNGQRSSLKSTVKTVKKVKKEERIIMSGVSSTKPLKKNTTVTVTPRSGKEVNGQDKKNRLLAG